jgi:hypothetical protein
MHTQSVINRYFELAPLSDTDAYFALFHPDATVEDEGREYHGLDAIRGWRREVPTVSYEVRDIRSDDGSHVARTLIAGDFPGSPVELDFHFTFAAGGLIESLRIRT